MGDATGFLKVDRREPALRAPRERALDWNEIYSGVDCVPMDEQARRCMDCGVPFCQSESGCPVENLIPEWNEAVRRGQWRAALDRLHATNNFPEFTGRLCPAPCESACVLGINSESVAIKSLEWSIVERGFEEGWIVPQKAAHSTGKRVAVVGSGPAGLAAAQQLARQGHEVWVFEREASPGGLLRYGIPDFKFAKWQVDRRLDQLSREGVRFITSSEIDAADFLRLQQEFDAVAVAIGSERPRDLQIPGRELEGIHFAMEYLVGKNKWLAGQAQLRNTLSAKDRHVIILGGGDTGSDCLGTALRDGAQSVRQFELLAKPPLQRSASSPWPEWPLKLKTSHAHEEGGWREWRLSTKAFLGEAGRVREVVVERVLTDGSAGEELHFTADLVLLAMGYSGANLSETASFQMDSRGNIETNSDYMTSRPGVFAAGDARRGASLIVWAIAEGRKMAAAMDRFLLQSTGPTLVNK